jgi:hypothetical protein
MHFIWKLPSKMRTRATWRRRFCLLNHQLVIDCALSIGLKMRRMDLPNEDISFKQPLHEPPTIVFGENMTSLLRDIDSLLCILYRQSASASYLPDRLAQADMRWCLKRHGCE